MKRTVRIVCAALLAATVATMPASAADGSRRAPIGKRESLPPPPLADAVPVPSYSRWICDDGQLVRTRYDVAAGIVQAIRGSEEWTLQEQVGTNPRRFVIGNDTVVIDGDMAELKRGLTARSTCSRVPDMPVAGRIWGDLLLPEGVALPAGSRGKVMLVDASRADAPALEIAATRFVTQGNQQPFSFLLQYEPEAAAPKPLTYRVMARIESASGKLLYVTDMATHLLEEEGELLPVELQLVAVAP